MSPLGAALIAYLTVWQTPAGERVLPRHVRRYGGELYVSTVASMIEDVAWVHGLDPSLVAAVALAESGLNPDAVGLVGERNVMQLHPETRLGKQYARDCRADTDPRECVWYSLLYGAEALSASLASCAGDEAAAIGHYASGRCAVGPHARRVLRIRDALYRSPARSSLPSAVSPRAKRVSERGAFAVREAP